MSEYLAPTEKLKQMKKMIPYFCSQKIRPLHRNCAKESVHLLFI
jgi:hypothetical protein